MDYGMMAIQGIKFLGQVRQRNAEYAQKKYEQDVNTYASAQARDLKIQQLSAQANQTAALYAQRKRETAIQALKAQEKAINEATFEGNTLDLRKLDIERQKLNADTAYNEQNKIAQRNIEYQAMGLDAEMQNRINAVQAGMKPPSLGMTLLEGAATAYAADYTYGDGKLLGTIFQSGADATGASSSALPEVKEID